MGARGVLGGGEGGVKWGGRKVLGGGKGVRKVAASKNKDMLILLSIIKHVLHNMYCIICNLMYTIVQTQVEKMRAELANLNHCAVLFLSRTAVNLSWYYYTLSFIAITIHKLNLLQ